jgi:glutamate synthase (NADPH/NADH) small chain
MAKDSMATVNPLNPKERVKIPRQQPREVSAETRRTSFIEVSPGLDEEQAVLEASRCLECRDPVCVKGCPVSVDIRGFIQALVRRDFAAAADRIRETNALPAICGRVCPQESQCELVCTMGRRFEPVAIGKLERFVADWEARHRPVWEREAARPRGDKVAVVGSGPGGLTCAAELARLGYAVTVFEALHALGGVLRYGIPGFRLPREVLDRELKVLGALGVETHTNFLVGRTATLDELMDEEGFRAVFLATGAGTPALMGIPGESLSGALSANEFLTRVNLMGADRFPEQDTPLRLGREVAVVGGGNTALDAVRTARRLGAERAYLVYRRSRAEMPARKEEVQHAEEEGVEFLFLKSPTAIVGDERGRVRGLACQDMTLGEPDASGRRRPIPVPGSEHVLAVQNVISALGQRPNPIVQATTPGLAVAGNGTVTVDADQRTSRRGVYAGGDLSRGGATVILAMRDGRQAAAAIHRYIQEEAAPGPGLEASEGPAKGLA